MVEIPPKFADRPPVNPKSRAEAANGELRAWKGAQGLAEDVRYYGQWMRDEAQKRIGNFYPKATLPDGSTATVIAWLWARTVRSPDPAAKGAMVPLVSSFMLSTKERKKAWVEPLVDPESRDGWRFEVRSGPLTKQLEAELAKGTKSARATFSCVLTGASLTGSYIDSEARAGRMSARLMAIVAEGDRARTYLSPSTQHEDAAASSDQWVEEHEQDLDLPDQQCRGTFASNALGRRYCFETYKDYFTKRQQLALATFSELASTIRDVVDNDCANAGLNAPGDPLHAGGIGAQAYADAIATYLAIIVGRCTDAWSSVTSWASTGEFIRNTEVVPSLRTGLRLR